MFNQIFPNAFGLDIGDLSVKAVQLKNVSVGHKRPEYKITNTKSRILPSGLIVDGEIQKPEEVRSEIQKMLSSKEKGEQPIRGSWVMAALPETKTFLRHIEIPKTPEEITEKDILDVTKKHIPFDEGSYYFDWQYIRKKDETHTSILVGATQKNISDMYTYLLESLNLGIIGLDIEALAIARSMITASKQYEGEARAILDIGATHSSLIIYDHDIIQFSKSLPFSGELINTIFEQTLHITHQEAEDKKKELGFGYDEKHGQILQLLSQTIDNLVENITEAIDFYQTRFVNPNNITHITMCGGGALIKKLPEIITKKLSIECTPGHVWKNLSSKEQKDDGGEYLKFATAIGLALRAADNPFATNDTI
ncbi:MAG: hypothetical protein COX81_03370 [Candidatus Magasanikbacteria bacterium CG_4_10_14_0_2_um_filter_37_12]|uniref:SHS2 domain-containing protein n=1 Tax=Candidatus Magasanikbacteria bacterium CG_4_10_14_0_2_um_filter_37_12 TaxID=1974637 RepID=A0A2M7V736_9BACT|nr:MAG: hypothetical protein COX81_03370 [Candidatus Magasanikbacteria bacterium CG_4_10_14_0_2_um_filter_37_12]